MVSINHMKLAIAEAREASQMGEVPVGAVIVNSVNGAVLSSHGNRVESYKDPTAHAEILALREAARLMQTPRLKNCDIYVTLEPCAMCAKAISLARIRRLYFATEDRKGGGVENGSRVFSHKSCNHKPEIYVGIREEESQDLLRKFFKERR